MQMLRGSSGHPSPYLALLMVAATLMAGCSGGTPSTSTTSAGSVSGGVPTTDLQKPPVAAMNNTYVGTQASNNAIQVTGGAVITTIQLSGGDWALDLDSQGKTFSQLNVSAATAGIGILGGGVIIRTPGNLPIITPYITTEAASPSFVQLQGSATAPGDNGLSIEIPGRAMLFRPGDRRNSVVVATQTSECLNLAGTIPFQFIALGSPFAGDTTVHVAYGNVGVSTTTTAASASGTQPGYAGIVNHFQNMKMFAIDGTPITRPMIADGVCGQTQMGFAINLPETTAPNLFGGPEPLFSQTAAIGPSGFFTLDQGQGTPDILYGYHNPASNTDQPVPPSAAGPLGLVGMIQPAAPLDPGKIVAGRYIGFENNAVQATSPNNGIISNYVPPAGRPIAFGQSGQPAGAGTVLFGGYFPADDVTQPALSNISINLGKQDASNNGLFPSVTVTVPDDQFNPAKTTVGPCSGQPYGAVDANGNAVCVFHGVAISADPEGKFALYLTFTDPTQGSPTSTRQFFLYQQ